MMTTNRRFEKGQPVDVKRTAVPGLGWESKGVVGEKAPTAATETVPRQEPVEVVVPTPEPARTPSPQAVSAPADDDRIEDTSDMRKFLLKQMVRAAKGEITTETVKNIVTLSQQVYNATSLELKAAAILKDSERSIRALELVCPRNSNG